MLVDARVVPIWSVARIDVGWYDAGGSLRFVQRLRFVIRARSDRSAERAIRRAYERVRPSLDLGRDLHDAVLEIDDRLPQSDELKPFVGEDLDFIWVRLRNDADADRLLAGEDVDLTLDCA